MPDDKEFGLSIYLRGSTWWVKGRLEGEERYYRESLGTRDEAVARRKVRDLETEARNRALLGRDAPKPEDNITLAQAFLDHPMSGNDARYMARILPEWGDTRLRDITPRMVKQLAKKLYPMAAVDTWHRQVVVPVRAIINAAHEDGLCPPIRIKAYTKNERVAQDRARGKDSGQKKRPGSWDWVLRFKEHAEPRLGAMALFMFTTGARVTQTMEMKRKGDLDLFRKRVRLPAAKGHPAQWIDILPEVAAGIGALPKPTGKLDQERVFYWASQRSGDFYRKWRQACKDAGIEYLPPHAAGRHGFGTEMIVRQKIDPATAARDGRWSSPKVLLDTYAHAEEGSQSVQQAFRDGLNDARTKPVQGKTGKARKVAENKGPRSA
ncbi:tyrosine-type recombinase/integrase [Devosia riboflavina]|uniref:tyrosine-type recombinase/integrase n=1 Tax=Devosia riboflavina TaxID=46914 RepID=UPI000A0371DF|nr:tyrosine-type recombinase/integrase [Devosia riboflavina]